MRRILSLGALAMLMAACNGGEDFSDASVPGCPAGAPCTAISTGDVLVELTGLQVDNLGYECVGTSVVFATSKDERTSAASDGSDIVVPPYNALCPASATQIRFFVGNGLFEGNSFTLGEMRIPQGAPLARYSITVSDLMDSPRRVLAGEARPRNVAAFLQGLDAEPSTPDVIEIPDAAHELADELEGVAPAAFTQASYDEFRTGWSDYFDDVNDAIDGTVAGMNPDPNVHIQEVVKANSLTRSGNYRFDTCRGAFAAITCVSSVNEDVFTVSFPARTTNDINIDEFPLILPTGQVMGIGRALRQSGSDTLTELVAFSETATVDDSLVLQNLSVQGIEPGGSTTTVAGTGAFLNKLVYTGEVPDAAPSGSKSDVENDYPGLELNADEKGTLSGTVVGGNVDLPLTAELSAQPQVNRDEDMISDLAAVGEFTVRLMRVCLDDDTGCRDIPNEEIEIGEGPEFNYNTQIYDAYDHTVTQELPREDRQDVAEFCVEVVSNAGEIDHGIVMVGSDGDCPSVASDSWPVGFVTRTFPDSLSYNLSLLLAPGAEPRDITPNFGVTSQGRVDGDAGGCYPMYRTGDDNFEAGLRALWIDDFYPYVQQKEWVDALPEGGELTDEQVLFFTAISSGAVEFFAGAPGGACDPAVP